MARSSKLTINPISRIEGHGKITIHLDENGDVSASRFHVTQFRGYERFCQGRPFEEMPVITQRICGICPVSHQLASAKACDAILGVDIPPAARRVRELLHMGQFIQSHALHFFHLASPDLLLGWDADPGKRNLVGLMAAFPDIDWTVLTLPVRLKPSWSYELWLNRGRFQTFTSAEGVPLDSVHVTFRTGP